MSQIFYYGADNKVYGPHTELTVQGWYASGFFSSDVRFQISSSDRFDPRGSIFTLGELIEKNGRFLPFYFSNEKEIRVKDQEEALLKLKEDVESLPTNKEKYVDEGRFEQIQNQVASLGESNTALHKNIQELSSKKESSPVTFDLEKKLNELKKEIDKQDKSAGSMKKVMSDNTSKCDRNDTKIENAVKKLREIEEQMSAHSIHIADLQSNGKDIDTNLTVCRETMRVSADQCGEMMSTWKEVKEAISKPTEEWPSIRSELQTVQTQITEVIATMDEHKKRFSAIERMKLRADLRTINGDSKKPELNDQQSSTMTSATPPPWELEKKKVADSDGIEPWNRTTGSTKNGSATSTAQAKSESKGELTPTKSENAVTPKPAKNWDAICKELSDDEEEWMSVEEEEKDEEKSVVKEEKKPDVKASKPVATPSAVPAAAAAAAAPVNNSLLQSIIDARPNVPRENRDLIATFVDIFRLHLIALRTKDTHQMCILGLRMLGFETLIEWRSDSAEFLPLAQAMLAEITKACDEMELICWLCGCRMFTPLNVFDHLVHQNHFNKMSALDDMCHNVALFVQSVIGKLSYLLKRTSDYKRENVMNALALAAYMPLEDNECLRPTREYVRSKFQEYREIICNGDQRAMMLANVGGELSNANDEYYMRIVRKWFKVEKNRKKFLKDLDEHLNTGTPHCYVCKMAFNSKDDFYKHVTSYYHATMDQRMFCGYFIRLARGTQDWDITM